MHVFDLHCDTLFEAVTKKKSIRKNDLHISVCKGMDFDKWTQCFAVWIPDDMEHTEAMELFKTTVTVFQNELSPMHPYYGEFSGDYNAVLTVENGAILNGNLENVKLLKDNGVKILTLTWNAKNAIGGGADTNDGITEFGKNVVKELESQKIAVDVSHACERLFYDVAEISTRPFIATHSNSSKITPHRRNLTDEQFNIIKSAGGVVGINFYKAFLNSQEYKADKFDILRHTEHFLSLGGEDTVCLGTDFDGADMPCDIKGIESLPQIYEMFLKHNYSESVLEKIFYKNAYNFFENFDF